jgi:hypothetical protein
MMFVYLLRAQPYEDASAATCRTICVQKFQFRGGLQPQPK